VDDHIGIGLSGLIADARLLCQWMRNECLNHKYTFETPMPVGRLVSQLSDKSQVYTQKADKRPYGVGLLVIGVDKTGPHLYQTQPSGNYFEYKAQAMGARSQSAKTYLEKHFESFENASLDELIKHALTALKGTAQSPLTYKNCTVAYVARNQSLTIIEDDGMKQYVSQIAGEDADVVEEEKEKEKEKKGKEDKKDGGVNMST